jgi:DNA polymerase-3 subunit epsilon
MALRQSIARLLEPLRRRSAWATAARIPIAQARFVIVDVETSGLDPRRDRLLSIGAVAVSGAAIQLADSVEIVLWQPVESAHDNILLHGISGGQQRTGMPADAAMRLFSAFVGTDTLVAYHADFDRQFLERAARNSLGTVSQWTWIDAAWLAPALLNSNAGHQRPLDAWCTDCGISHIARHNAASDALATAELLLILLDRANRKGMQNVGELRNCAEDERRLARFKPPI